jgi:hypothetical protein
MVAITAVACWSQDCSDLGSGELPETKSKPENKNIQHSQGPVKKHKHTGTRFVKDEANEHVWVGNELKLDAER